MTREGRARAGCSAWQYKHWRGVVYPEKLPILRWFEQYTTLFDTVRINNTFYRLPPPETVEKWEAAAPQGFTYATKLGQFGSHRMKLRDAAGWLPNHLDRVCRLGDHLGPTLVQLPPRWKRNLERLDEFLTCAPQDMRWAVELRDESWLHDDTLALLERHGAALCIHDLLADHPWERTTDWTHTASTARTPSPSPTTVSTVPVGWGASPSGWRRGWRGVPTSTPTSTTTGTATP